MKLSVPEIKAEIIAINNEVINKIDRMMKLYERLDNFIQDTNLQGQAYTNVRTYLTDCYDPVIKGCILAYSSFIEDNSKALNALSKVGDDSLIVDTAALAATIQQLNHSLNSLISMNIPIPAQASAAIQGNIAELNEQIKKVEEFDINCVKQNLYQQTIQYIRAVQNGLTRLLSVSYDAANQNFVYVIGNQGWEQNIQTNWQGLKYLAATLKDQAYLRILNEVTTKSYGGNQSWFSKENWFSQEYIFYNYGCGLIGLSDLFLYLSIQNPDYSNLYTQLAYNEDGELDQESYMNYVSFMNVTYGDVIRGIGLNGISMADGFNRYSEQNNLGLEAKWGVPQDQMLDKVREMLDNDIPVVFSVGPDLNLDRKKDKVKFTGDTAPDVVMAGHYATVTGIIEDKNQGTLLQISSWGEKYTVNYQEYEDYIKKQPEIVAGVSNNILYIETK